MFKPGIVDQEWPNSKDGEAVLQYFYDVKTRGRKTFGILERPSILANLEEVSYKVMFVSKTGIGKSLIISHLAGIGTGKHHGETIGIRVTNVYWPVKIWEKAILFKLQCWEAGSSALSKYSHIGSACKDRADMIVFLCDLNDRQSFTDLPQMVTKHKPIEETHVAPAQVVMAIRKGANRKVEVSQDELWSFEKEHKVHLLIVNLTSEGGSSGPAAFPSSMGYTLNSLCEILWLRDQQYIISQGMTV